MAELYIVRHGQCEANISKRITGVKDSQLTPDGIEQAHQLGRNMVGLGVKGIVTSPIGRAARTAEILGAYLDVPVAAVPHFRPQSFGRLEGYTLEEARAAGLGPYLHNEATDKYTHFVPGGETAMEVQLRVAPTYDVIDQMVKRTGQTLTVVTHNSVLRSIAGSVWKLPPEKWTSMTVPNCDILKLEKNRFEQIRESDSPSIKIETLYQEFKDEGLSTTRSQIARLMAVEYPGWEGVADQMIADGYLSDTVETTKQLTGIKKEALGQLLPQADVIGVVHYGSSSHSPYYSVRRDSDLDFDVIVKSGSEEMVDLPIFAGVRDRLSRTLRNSNNAGADICSFKFRYKGNDISMRLTNEDVFREICLNNPSSNIPRIIREFRDTPKQAGSYYQGRFSFDGAEHSWFPRVHQVEGGIVSLSPVSKIDKQGRYVNGVTLDKYVSQPRVYGNVDTLSRYIFQATAALVKRLIQEEQEGIIGQGSLVNLMARQETMPDYTKSSAELKEKVLRDMVIANLA